jgi:DNA-binding IclR family transcriptional regulator
MDSVSGVGVLDKAVALIRAVAEAPLDLAGLQAVSGLPRATTHRLAQALELHGILRRDSQGRFDLGGAVIALGRVALDRFPLAELSRPILRELRDSTGESVQLFVREDGSMGRTGVSGRRCVLSLQSAHGLRWILPEGSLLPLEVGSAGRVLSGEPRSSGWVQSVEEREPGVASVSAPVRDARGEITAAVSVSGPVERLSRQPGKRFGAQVVAAADQITEILLAG